MEEKKRTRSIRLTREAVSILYKIAGEIQVIKKEYVNPSEALVYIDQNLKRPIV